MFAAVAVKVSVVERTGLDSTVRSCRNLVLDHNQQQHLEDKRLGRPTAEHHRILRQSLAEEDDSRLAVAVGWDWSARPRDAAMEVCWIRRR